MPSFVSNVSAPTPAQMLSIAAGINAALRGETTNTGTVTVASGASSVMIKDMRCRAGRLAFLIPLNAAAAAAKPYLSNMTLNSMTFTFPTAPTSEAKYGWALVGCGD